MFIFYTDSYKVPCPVELLTKDEFELLMYTTYPTLEENKEDRKRKKIYWGLHQDEIRHRHVYNLELDVSSLNSNHVTLVTRVRR